MDKSATTQHYRIVINASAQAIWDAITRPEWTEKYGYGGRVQYELEAGGRYSHRASAEMKAVGMQDEIVVGEVIESDPPRKLVQTWHPLFNDVSSAEPYTRLTYAIDVNQSGVCTVTISHDVTGAPMVAGMVTGGGDPSQGHGGWPWVLSDLKSCLRPASACRSS
jgi:uncharacterized protein YndB with AHSA1/START domain